jgi:Mn-dependent DtxR family transcriptional regulator
MTDSHAVPPALDGGAYGTSKAIWLLLGRRPPLSATAIETALRDHETRVTAALAQLRDKGLIEYDRAHGGYRRAYDGGDSA